MITYSANHATASLMNSLRYSLVCYLQYAQPWVGNAVQVAESMRRIAQIHREYVGRFGELILQRRGYIASQTFPAAWTGFNDLSLSYLLPAVIEDEKRIVKLAEATAGDLKSDVEAYNLVAEVIETERDHLQILQHSPKCQHEQMIPGQDLTEWNWVQSRFGSDRIRYRDHDPWRLPSIDESLQSIALTPADRSSLVRQMHKNFEKRFIPVKV